MNNDKFTIFHIDVFVTQWSNEDTFTGPVQTHEDFAQAKNCLREKMQQFQTSAIKCPRIVRLL